MGVFGQEWRGLGELIAFHEVRTCSCSYKGTSLIRNILPPRITIGLEA